MCMCVYKYVGMYIFCGQLIMIALTCDIILSESHISGSCYSSWKASLIFKCQKCRVICER